MAAACVVSARVAALDPERSGFGAVFLLPAFGTAAARVLRASSLLSPQLTQPQR